MHSELREFRSLHGEHSAERQHSEQDSEQEENPSRLRKGVNFIVRLTGFSLGSILIARYVYTTFPTVEADFGSAGPTAEVLLAASGLYSLVQSLKKPGKGKK